MQVLIASSTTGTHSDWPLSAFLASSRATFGWNERSLNIPVSLKIHSEMHWEYRSRRTSPRKIIIRFAFVCYSNGLGEKSLGVVWSFWGGATLDGFLHATLDMRRIQHFWHFTAGDRVDVGRRRLHALPIHAVAGSPLSRGRSRPNQSKTH